MAAQTSPPFQNSTLPGLLSRVSTVHGSEVMSWWLVRRCNRLRAALSSGDEGTYLYSVNADRLSHVLIFAQFPTEPQEPNDNQLSSRHTYIPRHSLMHARLQASFQPDQIVVQFPKRDISVYNKSLYASFFWGKSLSALFAEALAVHVLDRNFHGEIGICYWPVPNFRNVIFRSTTSSSRISKPFPRPSQFVSKHCVKKKKGVKYQTSLCLSLSLSCVAH